MENLIGMVCFKPESRRCPEKNFATLPGVLRTLDGSMCSKVIICGDKYTLNAVDITDRNHVLYLPGNYDQMELDTLWPWVYQAAGIRAHYICCLLANTYKHEPSDIQDAYNLMVENNLQEVRSYDSNGVENGLVMVTERRLLQGVGSYMGAIRTQGVEIHYPKDLERFKAFTREQEADAAVWDLSELHRRPAPGTVVQVSSINSRMA